MVTITPTISTPIPFTEYTKGLAEPDPRRAFVENMLEQSDLMRAMRVMPAQYGKVAYMDYGALPAVGFRGLNQSGNQATGAFNLREEDTFFIDDYIFVDRAIEDRLGPDHRYKQEKAKSVALGQFFSQQVVKGDNSTAGTSPNGLQARCVTVNVNLLNNTAVSGGAALSLANMDQLYWLVNKPTHWIVPRGLMPFFDAAARNNSLVNQTVAFSKDDFGRRIIEYKGLPILFGYEPDDSPDLLPFTEVASGGGGAVTASIYCVNLGPNGFYAIEQTPLTWIDEGIVQGAPVHSIHVKWDWGLAREHPRACARLTSITQATIVA